MKALVFESYGKAQEVLKLKDIPEPGSPKEGEVKVKMLMSPLNPSDVYNTIEGTYKNAVSKTIWNHDKEDDLSIDPFGERKIPALPNIPGIEGVGVVVEAGKGFLSKRLMGKRVAVVGGDKGNWQEYNIVSAKQALPVNKSLSDAEAATSFVNPMTAYIMIKEVLKCKTGDFLLQSAGNSELGKMVIRLGKKFGFKTISLIRNDEQRNHLMKLGADHVLNIKTQDFKKEVYNITNGQGAQCALDPIGGDLPSKMLQCLGLKGKMLVYGTLTTDPLTFSPRDLMTPLSSVEGFFVTNWLSDKSLLKKLGIIKRVGKLISEGVLNSEVGKIYPFEDYLKAIEDVNNPGNKGKVLLKISE
ncbi:MAG: zinc-dependent alcohol dehydrogenase family protein [Flavobacteriales bacterium]|nr:zinc-dependent alcohol dehydrogenase family protein [Flavobacteriales bacterium]